MSSTDAELTRQAVEEILRGIQENKEQVTVSQRERKINPLGRTNKQFLGRTIKDALSHNKRTDEQTRKKCRKKLKELDKSTARNIKNKKHKIKRKRRSKEKVYSSDSDSDGNRNNSAKRLYKRKKSKSKHKESNRRKKYRDSRCSRSSSSRASDRKTNRYKEFECEGEEYYADAQAFTENAAVWALQPMLWNMQVQQMLHYKALIESSATSQPAPKPTVQIEELSSSTSPSLSDIVPSEDEMLTINLSSEDECSESKADPSQNTNKGRISSLSNSSSIEFVDSDVESVKSSISPASAENTIDLTAD